MDPATHDEDSGFREEMLSDGQPSEKAPGKGMSRKRTSKLDWQSGYVQPDTDVFDYTRSLYGIARLDVAKLRLREFTPKILIKREAGHTAEDGILFDSTISVFGKRGAGKSRWAAWFLSRISNDIGPVYVFTHTKYDPFWEFWVPPERILRGYDSTILWKLIQRHSTMHRFMFFHPKHPLTQWIKKYNLHRIVVVMDDLIAGSPDDVDSMKNDEILNLWYTESRHWGGMSLMLSQQVNKAVTPNMRNNTDLAVILKQNQALSIVSLQNDFGGIVGKSDWRQLIAKYTKDYRALVFDNRTTKDSITDIYFWSKAEVMDGKEFKLGKTPLRAEMEYQDMWRRYESLTRPIEEAVLSTKNTMSQFGGGDAIDRAFRGLEEHEF